MGYFLTSLLGFVNNEDLIDFFDTFLKERYELLIVIIALIFILVLSLWTMLERLQKKGAIALVPVFRFAVLFSCVGLNPFLSLLMIVPGVNLVMRVIFYARLVRKFSRNYGFVIGLVLLPFVFLPIVAFGNGRYIYASKQKKTKQSKITISNSNKILKEPSTQKKETNPAPPDKTMNKSHISEDKTPFTPQVEMRTATLPPKGPQEPPLGSSTTPILTVKELKERRMQAKKTSTTQKIVKTPQLQLTSKRSTASSKLSPRSINKPLLKSSSMPMMQSSPSTRRMEQLRRETKINQSVRERNTYTELLRRQEKNKQSRQLAHKSEIKNSTTRNN